jgi:hypothetical protein
MDHHCPVVGKCIAFRNHQTFIVMLHWGLVTCLLDCLLCCIMYKRVRAKQFMFFVTVLVAWLAMCVLFLLWGHMRRLKKNVTTLESLVAENVPIYDLGANANINQLLGKGWTRRWWPRLSQLTGFEWATPGLCRMIAMTLSPLV